MKPIEPSPEIPAASPTSQPFVCNSVLTAWSWKVLEYIESGWLTEERREDICVAMEKSPFMLEWCS